MLPIYQLLAAETRYIHFKLTLKHKLYKKYMVSNVQSWVPNE